jgi:glycolate oxidase iron-sulfur subunit
MQSRLSAEFEGSADGRAAQAIVRKCVHCGFCNATCPTYQLLGDELDGPRGRIYLIKQLLEGAAVTRSTQQHLDRCLTCLNCQTTCPSGVEFGNLVDIGRKIVDERVRRPAAEQAARWLLRKGLTSRLFGPAMRVGQMLRPLLPPTWRKFVPPRPVPSPAPRAATAPPISQRQSVLLVQGCVQPSMMPNIDAAAMRVFAAAGMDLVQTKVAGCCGALPQHLGDQPGALSDMRRNIDAWLPMVAAAESQTIVTSASACSLAIKGYGHALADDSRYAEPAAQISARARDLSEFLPLLVSALAPRLRDRILPRLALHPPCTLQHGQQLRGGIETHLRSLGFEVAVTRNESHLCCGSAGTYSVLQPDLALRLRDRKLGLLAELDAQIIVSANMGCIQHLQSGTSIPVKHWIEILDESLA